MQKSIAFGSMPAGSRPIPHQRSVVAFVALNSAYPSPETIRWAELAVASGLLLRPCVLRSDVPLAAVLTRWDHVTDCRTGDGGGGGGACVRKTLVVDRDPLPAASD